MTAESMALRPGAAESPYAWLRLTIAVLLSTIGGAGMWSVVVVLPSVQAEFAVDRADASLPYTLTMLCFGVGGIAIGRLVDRFGVVRPLAIAALALGLGYFAAGSATTLWQFTLAHGVLIGIGSAATFGPLIADVSHWFTRRRGLAVSICAAGNYIAGAVWPPVVQHVTAAEGWRAAYIGIGFFCIASMLPLIFALRRRAAPHAGANETRAATSAGNLRLSPLALQLLLAIAGIACCTAMSMPQVHIVAYCGDLGYGPARGAEMLSLMLGFGIVSRVASGFIADRIGGLATLLLGSALQGFALLLYLGFNGLTSLYLISALFGLFQGGIVPSYAIIVREYFSPTEAGTRVGIVLMATLIGMAWGGWASGAIFDVTGSYRAAFAHGLLWNLLNGSIVLWLLLRRRQRPFALA
jgi:MFS family permease